MQKISIGIGFITFLISLSAFPQSLVVQSGSFSVHGNTNLALMETSLINDGNFSAIDSSIIIISGTGNNLEFGGAAEITASNLKIAANCELNTSLNLIRNITMSSGLFTLNNYLTLGGKINGEREESRITSSGTGEIIKTVSLKADQPINPGNMGLTIAAGDNYTDVQFRRGHQSLSNGTLSSINRYYIIPDLIEIATYQFSYFDAELNGLNEENLLLSGEFQNTWLPFQSLSSNISKNQFTGMSNQVISHLSLFEGSTSIQIKIPTGFSPNSDGVNDLFVIPEIENYPNNQLIIFNQWGDVLFESSPYTNDWNGTSESGVIKSNNHILFDGTYFFVFYPNKNNKMNFKSGYLELKAGDNN
jgi:gliding motility-associated-like protein